MKKVLFLASLLSKNFNKFYVLFVIVVTILLYKCQLDGLHPNWLAWLIIASVLYVYGRSRITITKSHKELKTILKNH